MSEKDLDTYEDVTLYALTPEREQELLDKQIECNFIYSYFRHGN